MDENENIKNVAKEIIPHECTVKWDQSAAISLTTENLKPALFAISHTWIIVMHVKIIICSN